MTKPFTMYGWHLSYYAGKVRCYLHYKGIPFTDQEVSLVTLLRIKRRTGLAVMPVVVTPEGEWIQDTSVIIDRLEQRFPDRPVLPQSPVQRFASMLLETWGDEWWMPIAMHTRWTYPENYPLFEHDSGNAMLPGFPKFLQQRAVNMVATRLRGYVPRVGIRPEQYEMMDAWTRAMCDHLDTHFGQHRYLLGNRPTLGDFGLVGTMYGHLGRDPWPKRELIDPRRNLRAWIDRMAAPPKYPCGDLPASDAIPSTLDPVLRSIAREFQPMMEANLAELLQAAPSVPHGTPLPRGLGDIDFPMGNGRFSRAATPFVLWKMQRLLDLYRAMTPADQMAVLSWLRSFGGEKVLDMKIPRLRRVTAQVAIE